MKFTIRPAFTFLPLALALALSPLARAADPWLVYAGGDGPGKGKHVVLISGDEEYRSEEALPELARILSVRHGFDCTVLFAIDKTTGLINPDEEHNIPGTEALGKADLMIIATRFRDLPPEQMAPIVAYLEAGKPVIGMRTATHAFSSKSASGARFSFNSREKGFEGGFGRVVLGETWINHHGHHAVESTRGVIAPGAANSPILRGCDDIWGPTDVYEVRLPMLKEVHPLVLGQVLTGMKPTDPPLEGPKNNPMMPVAWTKTYKIGDGKEGKAFATTMGAATDLQSEGVRRMLVNAAYWAVGMEDKIPEKNNVELVGDYKPSKFGFKGYRRGLHVEDLK
jgi:type 1 glutamine amidotransferase